MEHEKDPEYDDFEAILERQSGAGDSAREDTWKPDSQSGDQSQAIASVDDAGDYSASDTPSAETTEQVRLAGSVNAFDAAKALDELLSDEDAALAAASQGPLAESDPNLLGELLQAQMADEKVTSYTYTQVEIITPSGNPGWIVGKLKETVKSAKELFQEDKPGEAYQREYYEARLLTFDQQCEVMDKMELEVLRLRRNISAIKYAATDNIKAQRAAGKLSKAALKAMEMDSTTPPGSYAEAAVKKVRRTSPDKVAKTIGANRKKELMSMMDAMGDSPLELGAMLAKKGQLSQLDAEWLKEYDRELASQVKK